MWSSVQWFFKIGIHDAAWVQAVTSLLLVGLTFVTLLVLFLYAQDTHKLANASIEQVRNAQMPFLALVRIEKDNVFRNERLAAFTPPTYQLWAIENQGNAPAINIKVSGRCAAGAKGEQKTITQFLNPIPPGGNSSLKVHSSERIENCQIDYTSLDGRGFRTQVISENEELQSSFRQL
jgi:hypothetical protein